MSAAKDGGTRRTWSLEERQQIVAEALAPGASVAAVARRHGLNANRIFKWVRRSREGWLDRRRGPPKEMAAARMSPELAVRESMTKCGAPDAGLKAACYDGVETGGEKSMFEGSREIAIGSARGGGRRR